MGPSVNLVLIIMEEHEHQRLASGFEMRVLSRRVMAIPDITDG